jgi:hypothetical protein
MGVFTASLVLSCLCPLGPQGIALRSVQALQVDSGPVANEAKELRVLLGELVHVPGAPWLRLGLAGTELDAGSFLRLTSLYDGAEQRLGPRQLAQWRGSSAYFNGDAVYVELVAAPGSGAQRLVVRQVTFGTAGQGFAEDQCGSMDDRVPSAEPTIARGMPVTCTAFLFDDDCGCLLSAGHCMVTPDLSIEVLQFQVPASLPSGQVQHPSPDHQYAVDPASIQGDDSVTGDWLYLGVFPNSNTGLTPLQAQGQALALGPPPPFDSAQQVRVTGYGVDFDDPVLSQTQQTHAGPRVDLQPPPATYPLVQFQVDTEPSSSGSPVALEPAGPAIAIHTDGGCAAGFANFATAIDHPDLQAALATPSGVCSKAASPWTWLGGGLAGAGLVPPVLVGLGSALPGAATELRLLQAAVSSVAFLVSGGSQLDLPVLGGLLVPTPDAVTPGMPIDPFGHLDLAFPWPAGPSTGTTFYLQYWVFDPAAPQLFSASNGLAVTVP